MSLDIRNEFSRFLDVADHRILDAHAAVAEEALEIFRRDEHSVGLIPLLTENAERLFPFVARPLEQGRKLAAPNAAQEVEQVLRLLSRSRRKAAFRTYAARLEKLGTVICGEGALAAVSRLACMVVPDRLFAVFRDDHLRGLCKEVGAPTRGFSFFERHFFVREQMVEVLGPPPTFRDQVALCHFGRWLVTREKPVQLRSYVDDAIDFREPAIRKARKASPPEAQVQIQPPPPALTLAQDPWCGFHYFPNNLSLLWKAREAARNGIHHEDLKFLLQAESPDMVGTAPERLVYQALHLDLLQMEAGGVVRRAPIEPPVTSSADLRSWVAPKVVGSVAGAAHLLVKIGQAGPNGCAVAAARSGAEPRLDDWALDWLRELKLVEEPAGKGVSLRLTGEGRSFADALSSQTLPRLPSATRPAATRDEPQTGRVLPEWPDVEPHIAGCADKLYYDPQLLPALYGAMARGTRAFVLFAGLSGTGKSNLAEVIAKAVDRAMPVGRKDTPNYLKVPVLPNWTDPSGLLGYTNILAATPRYEMTPALHFLLRAAEDTQRPYFLCLDEMNLARVEHYFAPFLSALDAREPIHIHTHDQIDEPPHSLPWPANLVIIGTLNVDASANVLSDKVLDRAFVLEFWQVNIAAWAEKRRASGVAVPDWLVQQLTVLHDILVKVRRHFGYRTCDDILAYMDAIGSQDEQQAQSALDVAVCSKVLTKLHGTHSTALVEVLSQLDKHFDTLGWSACREKVQAMTATLGIHGMTHFWA